MNDDKADKTKQSEKKEKKLSKKKYEFVFDGTDEQRWNGDRFGRQRRDQFNISFRPQK